MAITSTNQQQLSFLQDKIREIGSAIFFNQSDSVLKLPTSIVSSVKVDDAGYVWFYVQKPKQRLMEFDMEFPSRMDFYKKGMSYFLQISGKGMVVTNPEELEAFTTTEDPSLLSDMLLVKVKILKAEYFETQTGRVKATWWRNAINAFTTWFRHTNNIRPDVYYPAS